MIKETDKKLYTAGEINNYTTKDPLDIEVIRNDLNNYKRELKCGLPNE